MTRANQDTPKPQPYPEYFIGPREPHMIIEMPFLGYYESLLSREIESHEEQEAECRAEQEVEKYRSKPSECYLPELPEEAHLKAHEFADIAVDCMDYPKLHESLAKTYCDAQAHVLEDIFGFSLGIKFESLACPRFYDNSTDRLFAFIPTRVMGALACIASIDDGETLAKVVKDRHSSRSGFASSYTTDISAWTSRSIDEYDHNELKTILLAAKEYKDPGNDDYDWDVYHAWLEYDGIYQEYDQAMNWDKFDANCATLRAQKLEKYREDLALGAKLYGT